MGRCVPARALSVAMPVEVFGLFGTAGDGGRAAARAAVWREGGREPSELGGRRLDPDVPGLLPLLRTMSPLRCEAPPKAMRAPSRAALPEGPDIWGLGVEVEARDWGLCEPAMPQRATVRDGRVVWEHRIQASEVNEGPGTGRRRVEMWLFVSCGAVSG